MKVVLVRILKILLTWYIICLQSGIVPGVKVLLITLWTFFNFRKAAPGPGLANNTALFFVGCGVFDE